MRRDRPHPTTDRRRGTPRGIALAGLLACTVLATHAQPSALLDEPSFHPLKEELDSAVVRQLRRLPPVDGGALPWPIAEALLVPPATQGLDSPRERVLAAERDLLLRDLGLTLRGGYLEHFQPGLSEAEDVIYRRRAQVELSWDVLQGGYLDRRLEARELAYDAEEARYEHRERGRDARFDAARDAVAAFFGRRKAFLLERQKVLRAAIAHGTSALYREGYVTQDRLLAALAGQTEVDVRLAAQQRLAARAGAEPPFIASTLPVVALDPEALEEALRTDRTAERLVDLEMAKLRLARAPVRSFSLNPVLRYNIYHSPGWATGPVRAYFSAGLSFSAPLSALRSDRTGLFQATERQLREEAEMQETRRQRDLRERADAYARQLEHYRRLYDFRTAAAARVQDAAARRDLGDPAYAPLDLLREIDGLYSLHLSLEEAHESLYLTLAEITRLLPEGTLRDVVAPLDLRTLHGALRPAYAVYIWSETFARHTNPYLVDVLRRLQVGGRIYLSTGGQAELTEKARLFAEDVRALGGSVHLLVGNNELVHPENRSSLARHVADARAIGAQGLHLDVEPHTFDDWDVRRGEYLAHFRSLLDAARAATTDAGLALGVSIPVFYGADDVREIGRRVDEVVVMAYERTDPEAAARAMAEEQELGSEKLRVAVRPSDFEDLPTLRAFLDALGARLPVRSFALHDLETLLAAEPGSLL